MFDENNDIDFRSILEGAEEEVPVRVWEGVSAGLDKAARGKVVALWFRRAGIGVATAAAVAAVMLVLPTDNGADIVSGADGSDMIAVVENVPAIPADTAETIAPEMVYMAKAEPAKVKSVVQTIPTEVESPEHMVSEERFPADQETPECTADEHATQQEKVVEKTGQEVTAEWKDEWADIEETIRKRNVAFVLSGLTGTNAAQNEAGKNIFKRPDPSPGPAVTGVRQTSTNSTYDIPLSFGAGVRVGISPRWSIGAGMNYSMLSRKFYGTYTKVNEAGVIENSTSTDIRNTQHYIGIPVNAYYDILDSRKVNFYAYAGGTVEKCISDRYDILGTSIVHKEKADGMQWSANLGVGVSFKLGKHLGLYIDPSLRYYFDCDQPHNIRAAQPLMLGFEVGLKAYL